MLLVKDFNEEDKEVKYIDINCDLAQSFGVYKNDLEFDLLPYCSSVNISCGLHSGDPSTINNVLKFLSTKNEIAIGAHIGYPDIQGFGYREMNLSSEEIESLVLYQIGALQAMANNHNLRLCHVRPHGALYKRAMQDFDTMLSIAKAVKKAGDWLILLCGACENLKKAAEIAEINYAGEVFLDKKYDLNGFPIFEEEDVVNIEYSKNMLETLLDKSAVINENNGITEVDFHSIHLSMKHSYSMETAKMLKEKAEGILPLSAVIIKDKSWI